MRCEAFDRIAPLYDRVMSGIPYADWADYLELLVRHWGGSSRCVLDLACGTGSVGIELARRGSRVVGVDRALPMLRAGRVRVADEDLVFVRQDMTRLGLAPAFDLAVCLFDSVNYVLDLDLVRATFAGVRRAVPTGGLLIFDVNTELALERELFTQEDLAADAPVRLRWRSEYDRATRTTAVAMEFFLDDGTVVEETHRQRAYTPAELREALSATRWKTLAVYDAYTFNLPRRQSDRLFYVCRAT